ncbi:MAG TPA: DUF1990 domain-containing protein [Pyrinomonadaceae bacterium]|nr:DUF1990 domain-containing protein [Pyrinomonadaceae bacterium]
MFLLTKPSLARIQDLVAAHKDVPFSYPEVGATRTTPPPGYTVDHNRVQLGFGEECFKRAVSAIRSWKQFDLGWVQALPVESPLEVNAAVGVLARHLGFWSFNVSRVVYVIDEHGPIVKFGFAYGTLQTHVERGEERFTVEWHRDDDSVWYDILAFSRPNRIIVKFGSPYARTLQRRFARESLRAMLHAVNPGSS